MAAGTPLQGLSIVVPVLNEAAGIQAFLVPLQNLRKAGAEVIVVDGHSGDATVELATGLCDHLLVSPAGRARQMNAGAAVAGGDVLVFLHADTGLPPISAIATLRDRLLRGSGWGFCQVVLSGDHPLLRVVERTMNWRSRLTGVGTGDQVFIVQRALFVRAGGFPEIPLMEDVALAKRLKRIAGRPCNPGLTVVTSSRRWQREGILRTVLLMWKLRLLYFLGASPDALHRRYYR